MVYTTLVISETEAHDQYLGNTFFFRNSRSPVSSCHPVPHRRYHAKQEKYIIVQMKEETMRYLLFIVLLVTVILAAGCVGENKSTVVTPAPTTTPTSAAPGTTIPQTTVVSVPTQNYKTADLVLLLNTRPAYGFKMDYPSDWTYAREHMSWPSYAYPIKDVSGHDSDTYWKANYNFSSPDKRSYVHIFFDEVTGTSNYFYPITTWANGTIKARTQLYCLDGSGKPMDSASCSSGQWKFYRPVLMSNDPVTIKGSFEARKLVLSSYDDENYGQYTQYIMHSGQMQGYNFTIPNHPEVGVKVDGPAWDYGVGGQAYAIEFYTPEDQVNTTTDIFNRMITTFEITR